MADLCVIKKFPSKRFTFLNTGVRMCQRKRRCVIPRNTWVSPLAFLFRRTKLHDAGTKPLLVVIRSRAAGKFLSG
jgi:hypothetical protein